MQKIDPKNRFERFFVKYKKQAELVSFLTKMIGVLVILLILLELFSFLAVSVFSFEGRGEPDVKHKGYPDQRALLEVYQDKDWAIDYWSEFREASEVEYYPYVGFRRVPNYTGAYINLDENSMRKTVNPCFYDTANSVKVFVFGGSTIWGTGARDEGTIPSFISDYLCERGYEAHVFNFGENGYISTQELIKLQLELQRDNIPDVVVFYDGINDVFSALQNGKPGYPQNTQNRKIEFNLREKINLRGMFTNFFQISDNVFPLFKRKSFDAITSKQNLNTETVNVYLRNIQMIKSLEDDYAFKSFFYWQPILSTKKLLSEEEKVYELQTQLHKDYKEVSNLVDQTGKVRILVDIFDMIKESIYVDPYHPSESGNIIIAEEISEDIDNYLKNKR